MDGAESRNVAVIYPRARWRARAHALVLPHLFLSWLSGSGPPLASSLRSSWRTLTRQRTSTRTRSATLAGVLVSEMTSALHLDGAGLLPLGGLGAGEVADDGEEEDAQELGVGPVAQGADVELEVGRGGHDALDLPREAAQGL